MSSLSKIATLLKGTIYRIHSESERKEYIGSTMKKLSVRLLCHKSDYKKWLDDKDNQYCSSYEILKTDDYIIDVLEEVEVESKQELRIKEREWYDRRIETIGRDRVVNERKPYTSVEEVKVRHSEYNKEYREKFKEYREKNKDRMKTYLKGYRAKRKDKGGKKSSAGLNF